MGLIHVPRESNEEKIGSWEPMVNYNFLVVTSVPPYLGRILPCLNPIPPNPQANVPGMDLNLGAAGKERKGTSALVVRVNGTKMKKKPQGESD